MSNIREIKKEDSKVDLTLFSLAIDSRRILEEKVEFATSVNCLEDLTEEKQEEVKQLLAEAAGILIEALREKLVNYYTKK